MKMRTALFLNTFLSAVISCTAGGLARAEVGASAPSCEILKKRLIYRSQRTEELANLLARLEQKRFRSTKAERLDLNGIVGRSGPDLAHHEGELVWFKKVWVLDKEEDGTLLQLKERMNDPLHPITKAYVGTGQSWQDENGLLPEDLDLKFDETSRSLTLRAALTRVEVCVLQNDFNLSLELSDEKRLMFNGEWTFQDEE